MRAVAALCIFFAVLGVMRRRRIMAQNLAILQSANAAYAANAQNSAYLGTILLLRLLPSYTGYPNPDPYNQQNQNFNSYASQYPYGGEYGNEATGYPPYGAYQYAGSNAPGAGTAPDAARMGSVSIAARRHHLHLTESNSNL